MEIDKLLNKEFYIVDCMDFIYFARPVHIIGFGCCAVDEEINYIIDIKDYMNEYREVYMWELERFRTLEEAEKEAKRLNNIPSNKKRAKQWNTTGKFICKILENK